ncbi:AAA family ATPase [Agromyces mariniharenae]|uniref:AAA family ATPase n=2 Tax=Agromyces mariniharenae TaxID=2604423 RepID=A0A5S4UZ92_9MICO|nr:AAA family ATPase [Agromyces mariniharenae]
MAMPPEPSSPVFVGRERELGTIRGLLDRSAAEEAQALVVSGDAGVGKTALVAHACSNGRRALTIFGACLPLTSMSIPLMPIRAALRAMDEDDDGGGVELDGDDRDLTLRFDDWLGRRCRERPVVLVVDDVQWADQSTLDALMYVIAGPARRRLSVIATLRAGEVGLGHPLQRWLADIRRLPRMSELVLDPLDRVGTAQQLQALLGAVPHQSLIDDVHGRTRGNPYFTRLMVTGLPADARAAPETFPADLSSAVLQAWFRLTPETRRLATVLAVGGVAMHASELAEVVDAHVSVDAIRARLTEAVDLGTLDLLDGGAYWFHHPMNAEVLEASLGEDERREWHRRFAKLLEARLADPAPAASVIAIADHRYRAGETRAAFEWTLRAAAAAGDAAGRAEELRLLRRAVSLREDLDDVTPSLDDLLRRLRHAAADAGATGDELDAVEALLARVDERAEPLVAAELRVRRMHLRFMRGRSFIEVDEMREAVGLASADTSSREYAIALAELAHAELWAGDPAALAHARTAIDVARAAGDPQALSLALSAGSMAANFAEETAVAAELGHAAQAPALEARAWWAFVHASMWEANAIETWASEAFALRMRDRRLELEAHGGPHAYIAWLSAAEASSWLTVGGWHEADERLRVALGSDPGPLGDLEARLAAARLALLQGRQREAEGHLLRVEELVVDGSAFLAVEYDAVRAEVRLGAGDPVAAYDAALEGAVDRGVPPTMAEWLLPFAARALADRAQAARDGGEPTDAILATLDALVERFPHIIEDSGTWTELMRHQVDALDRMYVAERARARADAAAAFCWTETVEACADAHLPWEEAYARWRAAEALLGRGHDRQAGAEMLRTGLALARRLGARPVEGELLDLAARARVPIEEPAGAASVAPAALPGLTERERDVLDLIAVGRTYGEIARTLMISEKTVSTHVSHLLAKTGTANRVELARLVHRVADGAGPAA